MTMINYKKHGIKNGKSLSRRFLGFSVAEAMVTLLVVSLALSAAAPIFTKRNKQLNVGGSRWMITQNGRDINRANSKVGINLPANDNPQGIFDIRSSALNNDNLISISRGNNVVFSISRFGGIHINIPSANQTAISVSESGTETASINSNGTGQFRVVNVFNPDENAQVLRLGTGEGDVRAWMRANGDSSFAIPRGMIAFFNRPCSEIDGWSDVPEAWQGRYPRIVGNYNVCDKNGANCTEQTLTYNQTYGDAIRNLVGKVTGIKSGDNGGMHVTGTGVFETTYQGRTGGWDGYPDNIYKATFDASRSVPTAVENRVMTVGLYMCVKD